MINFERGDVFYRRLHPDVISNYFPSSLGEVPPRGHPSVPAFAKILSSTRKPILKPSTHDQFQMWKKAVKDHVVTQFPTGPEKAAIGFAARSPILSRAMRRHLIIGGGLATGITAADAVTSSVFPDPDKTRTQSAAAGARRGAVYGGTLAIAEPFLEKGVRKLLSSLDILVYFGDFGNRFKDRAKDAAIGGVTSAVGTAGLLAGAGVVLRHKAPDLSHMLGTAAKQHVKVFNPVHTIPMMKSLPAASRLFGKELRATKAVEEIATGNKPLTAKHISGTFQKTGINPVTDIKDITDFKNKWGRSPGETMEKSVGLLSGLAATGVGVAGGAALSKPKERRFSSDDDKSTFGRDIAIGSIEGGTGFLATDRLLKKLRPKTGVGKAATAAAIGGAATATIGYGLNQFLRDRRAKKAAA